MQKLTRAALFSLAAAALTLGGCKSTDACQDCGNCAEAEPATLSASTCPLSGKPVNPDVQTVAFQGEEVGFCCGGCAGKFAGMSDEDKAAALTH